MKTINHTGPERTNETLRDASALLHSIANGLGLKDEFELTYEKGPAGSRLVLQMIPPATVEATDGVVVDSGNKAAIDVDAAQTAETQAAKTIKRNGNPKPPAA